MPSVRFARMGKSLVMLAGVVLAISVVLSFFAFPEDDFSESAQKGMFFVSSIVTMIAAFLVLLALLAIHQRQGEVAGPLGEATFIFALLGTALVFGLFWTQTFVAPEVARAAPDFIDEDPGGTLALGFALSFFGFSLAWLLYGAVSLRARVFPKGPWVLVIIGAVAGAIPFIPVGPLLIGIALIWLAVQWESATTVPTPAERQAVT